LLGSISN